MTFLAGGTCARRIAVLAAAQVFLAEGEERRLADAAGDHDQVLGRLAAESRCRAGPRRRARRPGCSCARRRGHLAEHEVDDVDRGRLARGVEHRVVERERPAQERVVEPGEPQHQELARHDPPGDLGTREADAIRVAGEPHVLDDLDAGLDGGVGVEGRVERVRVAG